MDPISTLASLVRDEEDRIARLWAKRLRTELHELELPGQDLRGPLRTLVQELARLLQERGEEALFLWPEVVRAHAILRYEQRFEPEDLVRELKVLEQVLLRVYLRRAEGVSPEVVDHIAELCGEAIASGLAAFVRLIRTEEVRFREAAVMETVLHHVDVGILLADEQGDVTFATPPVSRLTGLPVRTLVSAHTPEALRAVFSQLGARHEDGQPFRISELPFIVALRERREVHSVTMAIDRLPEGEEVFLELSATPIWEDGNGGQVGGVVQTFTDRTEMVTKRRELTRALEELRRLQARLLQRSRSFALGQLASGTAHALNNFLNVVKLRLTLLRKDARPEHLDALDRTVRSVSELVARLQDFVVPVTEETLELVELDGMVEEAVQVAEPELSNPPGQPHIEVMQQLAGEKGRVQVDRGLLRELVVNLILSCRDRLPRGGTIQVRTGRDGNHLLLRIEDSGVPFSPAELAALFDPLKVKSDAPHLSLLLAAGRAQVQRWGGELSCEAGQGHPGSVRMLRLPLARPKQEPLPAPPPPTPHRHAPSRRVLVVDDDPENARMLAEVLADEGYDVKVAHSAELALRMWDTQRFDAALLDALMPEMSGWDLARVLRTRSPEVLLAMVTGADVRGQNRQSLALVDAVFRKPIDVATLDEFLSQGGTYTKTEGPSLPL